jgi:glutamine synthetase
MLEVERELSRLGVPIKTRHNEVAPAQYEVAPVFENSNLGADHQQLTMQTLKRVARNYGLVCLLHEKPFEGVNGSGKHNNWSIGTDGGTNLLDAGDSREEFLRFLFFCTAVIQAVDAHQGLLLASCANAGQDHRLGANEAPPGIISIFLGEELERIFERLEAGETLAQGVEGRMALGTPVLPELTKDTGDRNRTSPFAFTGNKFEFRMLGSSQSPSFANTVLNTVVAEALDDLSGRLEQALSEGGSLEDVLPEVMRQSYKAHKRIVFNGDNYTEEWKTEAEARGLLNLPDAADSLLQIGAPSSLEVFARYGVLSEREVESRLEVFLEQYVLTTNIESETAARIARTMLVPAVVRHLGQLRAAGDAPALVQLTGNLNERLEEFVRAIGRLDQANAPRDHGGAEGAAQYMKNDVMPALDAVREVADSLEKVVADDLWPLPKYSEMLFIK